MPSDGFLEMLQPLVAAEHGVGRNSTTKFMTHGTKDFPIMFAIYLSVSKVSVPDHIGLVLALTPILLTDAGPVVFIDMLPLLPQQRTKIITICSSLDPRRNPYQTPTSLQCQQTLFPLSSAVRCVHHLTCKTSQDHKSILPVPPRPFLRRLHAILLG